jgi:hypothetical protein
MFDVLKSKIYVDTYVYMVFKGTKFIPLSQAIIGSDCVAKEIGYVKHIGSREFDCYNEDALEIMLNTIKEDYDLLVSTIDDDCDWGILFRNGFRKIKINKDKDQIFWAKEGSCYYREYSELINLKKNELEIK